MSQKLELRWKNGSLSLHRCRVMGILNVTPDSFYDGGKYTHVDKALDRAWAMVDEGADILDIGAESSRPGSQGISADEEKKRLYPLLEKLAIEKFPLPISLDTTKSQVFSESYKNGWAHIANDVSGLRDPGMVLSVVALQAPIVVMHMVGTPQTMQKVHSYENVVEEILQFFRERLNDCRLKSNVILDPGIGFGKSAKHNLTILNRLNEFLEFGFPVMIGASRKSFIGEVLDTPTQERLEGSLAAVAIAVDRGAKIVRVHDVKSSVRVVRMVEAIKETGGMVEEESKVEG